METCDPIGNIRRLREAQMDKTGPDYPSLLAQEALARNIAHGQRWIDLEKRRRAKLITWLFSPLWIPLAVIAIVLLFLSAVFVLPFCGALYGLNKLIVKLGGDELPGIWEGK